MNPLNGIILGNLPFIGISYKGYHHSRGLFRRFSNHEAIQALLLKALHAGIREFAVQIPENEQMELHWKSLSEICTTSQDVSVIPNISIPILFDAKPLDVYRRWATVLAAYKDISSSILETVATDQILQCRPDWKSLIAKAVANNQHLSSEEISRVTINLIVLENVINRLSIMEIQFLEFGSEVDFLVASGRTDLLQDLIDLGDTYGYSVGFGVHHAALTIPTLNQIESVEGILTPINPIGLMMFPTKAKALQVIQRVRDRDQRLIAIKPLAGGHYSRVDQSLALLISQGIKRFMVGVSSSSELLEVVNTWNQLKK